MKKMLKKTLSIIIPSLILTAILTSAILYFFFNEVLFVSHGDQKFERTKWIENKIHQDYFPRLDMIDDLESTHLKIGMKRSEIINLLGKPDFMANPYHLSYKIGPIDFVNGDNAYLQLIFHDDQTLYFYDVID